MSSVPLQLTLVPVPAANGAIRGYSFDSYKGVGQAWPLPVKIRANAAESGVSASSNMDAYQLYQWRFVNQNDQVIMQLMYSPIGWAALVKWQLPLAITMTVMLLTPNLLARFTSERLAIPPVILLTLVFMQQAYRDSLPSLPYLTELDTLYAFSYVVTLVFFCAFIWRANRLQQHPDLGIRPLKSLELLIQCTSLGGYAGLLIWALTMT